MVRLRRFSVLVKAATGLGNVNPLTNVERQVDETDENNDEYLGITNAIAARRERRFLQQEEDASNREAFVKIRSRAN